MFEDNLEIEAGQVAAYAILESAKNTKPEKSPEELAAEAQLLGVVGGPEDEPGVTEPGQAATPITDPVDSLAGLLGMIGFGFAFSGFRNLSLVWSDDNKNRALASAAIPVLGKYAWGQRVIGMLQGDLPVQELALLMAAAPFAFGSIAAFKADQAEKQAAPEDAEKGGGFWSKLAGAFGSKA